MCCMLIRHIFIPDTGTTSASEYPSDIVHGSNSGLISWFADEKYGLIGYEHQMVTKLFGVKYLNSSFLFVALCMQGLQYKWGDFRLRIGKCINIPNESLRGIVMEVVTRHFLKNLNNYSKIDFSSVTELNLGVIKLHNCS